MEEETRGEMSSTIKDSTKSGRDNDKHITVLPGERRYLNFTAEKILYLSPVSISVNKAGYTGQDGAPSVIYS